MNSTIKQYLHDAQMNIEETRGIISEECKKPKAYEVDAEFGNKLRILRLIADFETGVFYSRQDAGSCAKMHLHPHSLEHFVVISGRMKCIGKEFGPGDICTVPINTMHAVEAITDCAYIAILLPCDEVFL
jgi:mannose-6-phosphate isomerase-like protein (cupin superfamily)